MDNYNRDHIQQENGIYEKYHDDYFTFRLSFDELIVFEEVNTSILEEFDLRSTDYIGAGFNMTYKTIHRDLNDDDYVIFRLLKLELID